MAQKDLTHADWLIFTQQCLVLEVNPNISVVIQKTENKNLLIIQDIPEENIDEILFITNTDQNNNYGYLEDINVYTNGSANPVYIPGLVEIAKILYRYSDKKGFLNGNKTHGPFNPTTWSNNSGFTGSSFNEFVDQLTDLIPYIVNTYGKVKKYELVFNPDDKDK